jgi:hypothetical protein
MDTKQALATITDDLLAGGEVNVEHVYHYGAGLIVCYTVVDSGEHRVAIYSADGDECLVDVVVEASEF